MSDDIGKADPSAEPYLQVRTFAFACRVVKMCQVLDQGGAGGRMLAAQLMRTGAAIGETIDESLAVSQSPEYWDGVAAASKRAREARYWLRLVVDSDIMPESSLDGLLEEASQLSDVLTDILRNSKRNGG